MCNRAGLRVVINLAVNMSFQDIDFATRKIAKMLKPQKVIKQEGDMFTINTTSTFRNYFLQFKIGEEFEEDNKALDNRKCKVRSLRETALEYLNIKLLLLKDKLEG